MRAAIEVTDLRRTYGAVIAVDSVSFAVEDGEIFGIVGPNGAGKTTAIECIEGLRRPDSGQVTVLGLDPIADHVELSQRIGIQLQTSALPPRLRVGEALRLFGSFYRERADPAELLPLLGLADKRTSAFNQLSGGQQQRLFIALALVNRPQVVFFDELTTGLDPQARRALWDLVRQIRDRGCTVVLTTHYMEEAERLCDRVLIIDRGRIVALDAPEVLIRGLGGERRLIFTLPDRQEITALGPLPQVRRVERSGDQLIVHGEGDRFVSTIVGVLEEAGVAFLDLRTEQPSLEDVFLALTGREMRD